MNKIQYFSEEKKVTFDDVLAIIDNVCEDKIRSIISVSDGIIYKKRITMSEPHEAHVSNSQHKKSKCVTFVWHQHVGSCVLHQYDPITGQTVRLDVRTSSNSKKHKRPASNITNNYII